MTRAAMIWRTCLSITLLLVVGLHPVPAEEPAAEIGPWEAVGRELVQSGVVTGSLRSIATILALGIVPAALMLTTGFARISVVLGLLRQAFGASVFLSPQIVAVLSLALTVTVMAPIWKDAYDAGVRPYLQDKEHVTWQQAWTDGVAPIRQFMTRQIDAADNANDVRLFWEHAEPHTELPASYDDVPLHILLPAFLISELKAAFLIGFHILLPFLVIDLVVSLLATGFGMPTLNPTSIALPLKLIVFVLADGWHLVVGSILQSFGGTAL